MLVNHQVVAPGGGTIGGDWIAPLKAVHIDHAAELRLIYWKGNNALKGTLRVARAGSRGNGDDRARRKRGTDVGPSAKGPAVVEALNATLGFVVEGTLLLPLSGEISLQPCNSTAANKSEDDGCNGCATAGGSSVKVNGTDLTMQLCKAGNCVEHIDRALTPSLLSGGNVTSNTANFTLLQRRGMWEFYLSGFLALPERLAAAHECLSVQVTGGLVVDRVWDMTEMPPQKPVAIAPTWPTMNDEDTLSASDGRTVASQLHA
eukprot:SAG31_NODE_3833_length_3838_cov_2.158866_3_plen_261_part_00